MAGRDGFSLVEMIVVSALFILLGVGILIALMGGQTSYLSMDAYVQAQEEARRAFDFMTRELRLAGWDTIPLPAAVEGTQLDFQVALGYNLAGCTPNAICWGAYDQSNVAHPGWFVRYLEAAGPTPNNPTQLVRRLFDGGGAQQGPQQVLANNVVAATTSFNWAPSPARTMTINLQIRVQHPLLPGGSMPMPVGGPLTSQIRLRNASPKAP